MSHPFNALNLHTSMPLITLTLTIFVDDYFPQSGHKSSLTVCLSQIEHQMYFIRFALSYVPALKCNVVVL